MVNKCPFCGKRSVIVNSFFGKYYKVPPYFCSNCGYVWCQEDMESSKADLTDSTEFGYGLNIKLG